jgi:hypothetical protein
MKPVYEIVTAAELEIGDIYTRVGQSEINSVPVSGIRASATGGMFIIELSNGGREHIGSERAVFRRIPATDDPRVLRRALGNLARQVGYDDPAKVADSCVEDARQELESEGGEG